MGGGLAKNSIRNVFGLSQYGHSTDLLQTIRGRAQMHRWFHSDVCAGGPSDAEHGVDAHQGLLGCWDALSAQPHVLGHLRAQTGHVRAVAPLDCVCGMS